MEFNEKLQELRKNKGLTQEELAEKLYVSRTAVSKWESGRGYPSIDSLKEISKYFSITLDSLLSSEEILSVAEQDNKKKQQHFRDLAFGLLDCGMGIFIFLPLFGQKVNNSVQAVPLITMTNAELYVTIPYFILILGVVVCGILTLAMQNSLNHFWTHNKGKISVGLSAAATILFMVSLQPYAAMFTFLFLVIKALMLIKWE